VLEIAEKARFLKQISFKYMTDFTGNTQLIGNLRENIIFSAKELMDLAKAKNVNIETNDKILAADTLTADIAKIISDLLKNNEFMDLLTHHGDELGLQGGISGTEYLFTHAVRISAENYKPTDEDVLFARAKTTGIETVEVDVSNDLKIQMYDIGGQRSERKKWPKIFNKIGTVIFMCALNEYDMVLEEANKKNRLHESLKIWEKLTKSQHFYEASFVLLFNKCDIFEKKIQNKPLNKVFTNFDEFAKSQSSTMTEYDKSWKYIEDLFRKRFHGSVPFDTLVLNSTDKENFSAAWTKVIENITKVVEKVTNEQLVVGDK